jgi:hypothetical protein
MEHFGGGGDQNRIEMQNHILHMILHMWVCSNFAWFSFEFGKEFGVVVLGKVEVLDVVLEEVQRVGQV